jgi:flagellar biosynthetic protein FliR
VNRLQIPTGIEVNGIDVFLLVFVRMTGLFVISPIFGRRNIPTYLKIGISLLMALILINTLKTDKIDYVNNIYSYSFLIFKEFIVGIIIGYVSYLIFTSIYLAGQLIDMQIGFGMVNVIDPVSSIQISITSNFYFIISMLVLLAVNGHHMIIKALFDSYKFIPVGEASFNTALLSDIIRIFGDVFVIAFKISAPVVAAILITDIALGIISKSVPQLNVFVVGMPAKIILGILVMVLTMPVFIALIEVMVSGMDSHMYKIIKDMVLK